MINAKVDLNQSEIIAALRRLQIGVIDLHRVGHGCPDFAAGIHGINYFMECKAPGVNFLTPDEFRFHSTWPGQVAVVHSVDEALKVMGLL